MTTKLGRMVIYLESLLSINSYKALIKLSSPDRLKPVYHYYKSAYDNQTHGSMIIYLDGFQPK